MIGMSSFGNNGRLGNQLFQISFLLNYPFLRDIPISVPKENQFFHLFEINTPIIDIPHYTQDVKEIDLEFNEEYLLLEEHTNFIGYFQSEKYLPFNKWNHSKFLRIKYIHVAKALEWFRSNNIKPEASTGVHIRKGDYSNTDDFYYIPKLDYYKDAAESLNRETIVVFSDGEVTNEEISAFKGHRVVVCNEKWDVSFVAMSLTGAQVISASTYGWWASFFSPSNMSICPNRWYGDKGPETKDHILATHLSRWSKS